MAQAITTKFAGPTNTRGSRIIVTSWLGRTTFSYNHALDIGENHAVAIREHIKYMGQEAAKRGHEVDYKIVGDNKDYWHWMGHNAKGDGYVAVVV